MLRFDYLRDARTVPCAHINVHAHRGALSHLLSRAGDPEAHDMAKLHIPVGGARFRPCLEDVLQFLVQECRFDSLDGWLDAVKAGREQWRRTQVRAATRDFPEEAAGALRTLGYAVGAPAVSSEEGATARFAW